MMDLVTKLNLHLGKGFSGSVLAVIARHVWVEKLDFYELDSDSWISPKVLSMRVKVDFMFGNEEDVGSLCADENLDAIHERDYYLKKLHLGHSLLLAKICDEIVFYLWIVSREKKVMNRVFALNDGEIAIERGFTRKEYRGHGLFVYGFLFLMEQRGLMGFKKCYTEIAAHNRPMINTAKRCGFQKIDSFFYWLKLPFGNFVFPVGSLKGRMI